MKLNIAMALACLLSWPAFAQTPDDTFLCLDELNGPVIEGTGDQGYQNYDWFHLDNGTRLDFRGAIFYGQNNPLLPDGSTVTYPVDVRVDSSLSTYCVAGPTVVFTNDPDNTWLEDYSLNHAGIILGGGKGIIDGARVHGSHDAFRAWDRDVDVPGWEVRNSWVTYNRDDCIENDSFLNLLLEDNLFDGCYTFYSSRNSGTYPPATVTIQNNLIRMEGMPGPYRNWPSTDLGHSGILKIQSDSPSFRLYDNIFLVEQYVTTQYELRSLTHSFAGLSFGQTHLADCRNNIIVWTGPGEYPGDVPDDPSCVTITTDRTVWENAVAAWKANHPLVPRVEGIDDPGPEPDPDPTPTPPPENQAPVAQNDETGTPEDNSVTIAVLANDSHPDGDLLTITAAGGALGDVAISGDSIIYTPPPDFFGSDGFSYTISNGQEGDSASVAVQVASVNDAPVAASDSAQTPRGVSVLIDVLANDSDIEGDPLTLVSVSQPKRGTAVIQNGQILYTPSNRFNSDNFTYSISDGQGGFAIGNVHVRKTRKGNPK